MCARSAFNARTRTIMGGREGEKRREGQRVLRQSSARDSDSTKAAEFRREGERKRKEVVAFQVEGKKESLARRVKRAFFYHVNWRTVRRRLTVVWEETFPRFPRKWVKLPITFPTQNYLPKYI